jgi:membrane-anchored mycosin MYCP
MSRPTARPVLAALVSLLALALPAAPAAARAPSGCASPPEPARPVAATPWPQQRYAPERLTPLADGAGVVVAVIDSGVDRGHPQLAGRVLDGADFLEPGGDGTRDCAGHGTGVASLIAATARPGVGFRGLAPAARILPVRVS